MLGSLRCDCKDQLEKVGVRVRVRVRVLRWDRKDQLKKAAASFRNEVEVEVGVGVRLGLGQGHTLGDRTLALALTLTLPLTAVSGYHPVQWARHGGVHASGGARHRPGKQGALTLTVTLILIETSAWQTKYHVRCLG